MSVSEFVFVFEGGERGAWGGVAKRRDSPRSPRTHTGTPPTASHPRTRTRTRSRSREPSGLGGAQRCDESAPRFTSRRKNVLPPSLSGCQCPRVETVVNREGTSCRADSPAARELDARFGAPSNVAPDIDPIGRFIRALNVALNIDMAKQRLRAAETILNRFHDQHRDIQVGLINLAIAELDDALEVLTAARLRHPALSHRRRSSEPGQDRARGGSRRRDLAPAAGPPLERHLAHREHPRSDRRQHHVHPRRRQPVLLRQTRADEDPARVVRARRVIRQAGVATASRRSPSRPSR